MGPTHFEIPAAVFLYLKIDCSPRKLNLYRSWIPYYINVSTIITKEITLCVVKKKNFVIAYHGCFRETLFWRGPVKMSNVHMH